MQRYSPETLVRELGDDFAPVESIREDRTTPGGAAQRFLSCRFRRQ
ncbi:MAG: hypothetical protein P4L71_03005 [Acetobacteraceae bacterium]|nr:hypothetical protein [Acetobacteraceae bacterium]